jgi:hypothetical protein
MEFGQCTRNTLRKMLAKNSALAGADGLFSTQQITEAIFGGLQDEKLATQRQITEKLRLENEVTKGEYVSRDAILAGFDQIAAAMTSIISTSGLPRESQEDILRELSSIPVIVKDAAHRQSKLRRSKNGQAVEEDESKS